MTTLRITGAKPGILKVHHTKYLMVMGLGLAEAKHLTDDILEGKAREVQVSSELASLHAKTLQLLGAVVESVVGEG
jgi:ribosomal protein L7/L12